MTALLDLPAEFGRVVEPGETHAPGWLVDNLIAADGLTAITGGSKIGKTTLAIQAVKAMRDPKGYEGHLCGSWIERRIGRVLVIATFGQHAQYANAFVDDADVAIIEAPGTPAPGFWKAYAGAAEKFGAELVAIDTVQSLAGAASQENLAGLFGFSCPVLGVFTGHATTPGISDGAEYQSLAISSLWLHREKKAGGELIVTVMTRWTPAREVPATPGGVTTTPLAAGIDEDQVRQLGTRARMLSNKGGGPQALASKLLAEDPEAVARICGRTVRTSDIADAITAHAKAWDDGLHPARAPQVTGEEPPF